MSLRNQVALITHGGKNVESARQLAREGAQLAIHYNSTKSRDTTLRLRDELRSKYPGRFVSVHGGDLGSATGVENLFSEVLRAHPQVDVVVNSAGTVLRKPATSLPEIDYNKMFAYAVFVDEQRRQSVQQYDDAVRGLQSAT